MPALYQCSECGPRGGANGDSWFEDPMASLIAETCTSAMPAIHHLLPLPQRLAKRAPPLAWLPHAGPRITIEIA